MPRKRYINIEVEIKKINILHSLDNILKLFDADFYLSRAPLILVTVREMSISVIYRLPFLYH